MTDPDLNFIARQIDRVLAELRDIRERLSDLRDEMNLQRNEMHLLREQVRIQASSLARLNDTITMNVLDRLRALESRS